MPGIGAIVLAAGASTRMGHPKQLLLYEGQTLLRRAARAALAADCRPVVVVLGCRHELMTRELAGLSADVCINADWSRGIGTSIRAGVRRLLEIDPAITATVLMLCDQPLVNEATIRRLHAAFDKSCRCVCVSTYAETLGPPVLVGAEYLPKLLTLPDGQGAKSLWQNDRDVICTVPAEEAAVDLDTMADYERIKR